MTRQRDRAAQVQARFAQRVEAVRADAVLSDEGRRRRLAAAFVEARGELRRLRDEELTEAQAERERLERRLYGLGPAASVESQLSLRDAAARAEAAGSAGELRRMYEGARRRGDTLQVKAALSAALSRGVADVVAAAAAADPAVADTLNELDAVTQFLDDKGGTLVRSMHFSVALPAELARHANDVDRLAEQPA